MPRVCRPIGFHSTLFETRETLVVTLECWMIWWSDGPHVIVVEDWGDDTLVDIGVYTYGDLGLVTLGNRWMHQQTQVYTE